MERIWYMIEELDGTQIRTKSKRIAEIAFLRGCVITEVKSITTYTEHTRIVLITYETKTYF